MTRCDRSINSAVLLVIMLNVLSRTVAFTTSHDVEGVNGGSGCLGCTALVSLIEQLAEINNATVVQSLDLLCTVLPKQWENYCFMALKILGPPLVEIIEHDAGPDVVCHVLAFCHTEHGQPTCRSVVPPGPREKYTIIQFEEQVLAARFRVSALLEKRAGMSSDLCQYPGIKEICALIDRVYKKHKPLIDLDNDLFSTFPTMRGTSWRGRDCSDENKSIHPGVKPLNQDRDVDSNCNGIFGVNNHSGVPYEAELCENSQPRGVAVLGDSLSAHFHIPAEWFDATKISKKAFEDLPFVVANELDWPMLSSTTGFTNNTWPEAISGSVDSIYLRLRQRNRCNHRDYQNIAINGEKSRSMTRNVKTFSRDGRTDLPVLVFYAIVGNDVCNGHPDTIDHMTTPREMYVNTMNTLVNLNSRLPNNSHVIMVGLAEGQVLYESMADRIHPMATHWGRFTYQEFYEFQACLGASPCRGWLTSNATTRNFTTQRANELSAVLKTIYEKQRKDFKNINIYYMDHPIYSVIKQWTKSGGEIWQLIESIDGFHVNQVGQALLAKTTWEHIEEEWPHVLGPVNKNNDIIEQLFGDQGGY